MQMEMYREKKRNKTAKAKRVILILFKMFPKDIFGHFHPAMKTIDPLKLELIRTAAKQTKGKSGNELAPVMLALITNANRQGLRFNPDEVSLILEVLKEGKSKEEQNQIDRMMEMTKNIFRKHFK